MAFVPRHNITGSSGVNVELIAAGEDAGDIISILIANTHATADATVSLFVQNDTPSTFYFFKTLAIPADTSLLINDSSMLTFDNSIDGFSLNVTVGGSDTLDIMINR